MKAITTLVILLIVSIGNTQSLPIDFETSIVTSDFIDFDGGTATVIPNPQSNGINTSSTVAQIVRNGGQPWSGSKLALASNLNFSSLSVLSMKVYTSAPIGTTIKFKLEGTGETSVDVVTTTSNEWETLTWDFTGQPSQFNDLVFMFDFGNTGDGSANSTFLFDDIEQLQGLDQIDLPVDFESTTVNYTMTDFEGNTSMLTDDPTDANNTVAQVMKTPGSSPSAGTTIGRPSGFATNIPLTLSDSKMTVRVWSPEAGLPIRLKVEDSNDPTHTCETETNTTVGGAWETLEFDFTNQAPGTELLSVGLSMGWTYNMASIFFNFGVAGANDNGRVYYFDDVKFGELVLNTHHYELEGLVVFPNPTNDRWTISNPNALISTIELYDLSGKRLLILEPNAKTATIESFDLPRGTYLSKISTSSGVRYIKLIKS